MQFNWLDLSSSSPSPSLKSSQDKAPRSRVEVFASRNNNSQMMRDLRADPRQRCKKVTTRRTQAVLAMPLLIFCGLLYPADSLRFTSIQMPALVQRGTNFWLACQYELAGGSHHSSQSQVAARANRGPRKQDVELKLDNGDEAETVDQADQLYSVKWYKNNEEFYRLIFAATSGGGGGAPGQQQYFAQPGVNVMMSSSNATHVRLLNASLESDGTYACEISTQNLSTIRFEKEIRVYVLPHAKLNLIGLRSLYSLGDRVELQCLSDFSRPAGALGWFINGQHRITTTANSSHHFLLGSLQTKAKAQEPKLSRSSLVLKFKLTSELVASVRALDRLGGAAPGHSQPRDARQTTGSLASADITRSHRNQSHGFPQKGPAETQQQVSGARLMELLRLECRYKLTEVSDVTFNELRVSGRPSAPSGGPSSSGGDTLERRRRSSNQWRHFELTSADINVESSPRRATDLKLFKSHTNQVMQSNCPARRRDLMLLLQPKRSSSKRSACRLGLLALQREDPAILADESDSSADPTHEPLQLMNSQSPPELPIGSTLSVNCSTLGALSWSPLASSVSSSVSTSPSWSTFARGRSVSTATDNELQAPHQQRSYCDDQEARRRLLISGKHPWPSSGPLDQVVANQRSRSSSLLQQQPNNRRDHVAYVTLDPTTTNTIASSAQANSKKRQQQQQSHDSNLLDDKLSLPPEFAAADSSNFGSQQQDQLHNNNEQTDDSSDWLAPPLLEWFINDQEAPRSSASYSPELPLTSTKSSRQASATNDPRASRQLNGRSREGTTTAIQDSPEQEPGSSAYPIQTEALPSIDYMEYFANFQQARPVDQHLMLRLKLEKRHLTSSPDSLLRLRCTSTQAQVLAVDALSVSLFALPVGASLEQNPSRLRQEQQASHWNQRPAQTGSQIKPKYLHQHPRSSTVGRDQLQQGHRGGQQQEQFNLPVESNGQSSNRLRVPILQIVISLLLCSLMGHENGLVYL